MSLYALACGIARSVCNRGTTANNDVLIRVVFCFACDQMESLVVTYASTAVKLLSKSTFDFN